jgi:hypothetical protein
MIRQEKLPARERTRAGQTYYRMTAGTAFKAVPQCPFQERAKVSRRPESISMLRWILSIRAF